MRRTRGRRLAGGILVAAAVAGCAIDDVTLKPTPPAKVATGSRRGEGREILLVRPFANRRKQARCGMRKNGYNVDAGGVLCAAAPEFLLADLVAWELTAVGFKVLVDPRQAGPSTLVLTGALDQVFLEPKMDFGSATFETDIALSVRAQTATGLVADRRFYVKGQEATHWASDEDMQRSFESGARQLVADVVGAVANLADRFPAERGPEPAAAAAPNNEGAATAAVPNAADAGVEGGP